MGYLNSRNYETGHLLYIYQVVGDNVEIHLNEMLDFNDIEFKSFQIISMHAGTFNSTKRAWKTVELE